MVQRKQPAAGTPRPEVLAFLADIKQHPEDAVPRLILADWLEEHGHSPAERARGELIRLQCRLAARPCDPQRADLESRERELLRRHAAAWLGPLGEQVMNWRFRRGLLDLTCLAPTFVSASLEPLGAPEGWAWVERLELNGLTAGLTTEVAASPLLAHLGELDLTSNGIRGTGVEVLAASPHLAGLTSLVLDGNPIGVRGARALAASPHLGRLTSLSLRYNQVSPKGIRALATSPLLAHLTELNLSDNQIGDEGVEALAASPQSAGLLVLGLGTTWIGYGGVKALADSPYLAHIAFLELGGNGLTRRALRTLIERFGDRVRFNWVESS